MRFLFFVLLIVLIAQVGFWKVLGAVVGAFAMIVLLTVLVVAVLAIGAIAFATGLRQRW